MRSIKICLLCLFGWVIIHACSSNPYKSGKVLYTNFCAGCHGGDGEGLGELYPPLKDSDYLRNNPESLTCIIRKGMTGTIKVNGKEYKEPMAAIPQLDDIAINNINNYINYRWPYKAGNTTIIEVREALQSCE